MARVIVIGAGLAGLAAAVRLAKLGHQVTICEQDERLGGALGRVDADGFSWDAGAASTTLPAALRDLFRKSGRPIESLVQLDPITEPRRHLFCDGSVLDLPVGDRAGQLEAWTDLAGDEDRTALDGPGRQLRRDLAGTTEDLARAAPDEPAPLERHPRVEALAVTQPSGREASRRRPSPRSTAVLRDPARLGPEAHARLRRCLVVPGTHLRPLDCRRRLRRSSRRTRPADRERKIDVRTEAEVVAVSTKNGVVTGVRLADGTELPADIVVSDIDPRELYSQLVDDKAAKKVASAGDGHAPGPGGVRRTPRSAGACPGPAVRDRPARQPTVVVRTGGVAPAGHQAWSVLVHGYPTDDVLDLLVARGLHIRDKVVSRQIVTLLVAGVAWEGYRTARTPRRATSPPSRACTAWARALTPAPASRRRPSARRSWRTRSAKA